MAFPNFKNKHAHDAIFSPKDFILYKKILKMCPKGKAPEAVIICYVKKLFDKIVKEHGSKKLDFFPGQFYLLKGTKNKVAITGRFGIGSPVASVVMEELIALGVKKFINIGAAGTLQKNLKVGDIVLCDKAIRDEGTSHHYIKTSKYSFPSKTLTGEIKKYLDEKNIDYFVGPSWTIDAPYRETVKEARQYQKEGVLTVEMEASALFAVAKYRKVKIASLFAISDSIAELKWKPRFHGKKYRKSIEKIFEIAKEILMD